MTGLRCDDDPRLLRELARFRDLPVNFDVAAVDPLDPGPEWTVDDQRRELPAEPPGPPLVGGPWERACALVRDYKFADPTLVSRACRSTRELEPGADLLLETSFHGLVFRLPCRVGGITDTARDGVRVWGWNYRTLRGHLEQGQMDFLVRKDIATGTVEFQVRAFSRHAHIPNPVVRLGFAVFGRSTQLRFIRGAGHRMVELTEPVARRADRNPRP
ncbi:MULTISPECIES: DUF1990 family protein [unclassified Saccharopolyspora]|uniref:DUF1990 family protein n=1 Tax=unclassified Saccharopolyspora TaxID=2646250 RepID=UPI001CD65C79|nr:MULTISPECIES: DUF1990 family protein [unclassified Saccharopolyspora]MCA1192376.1 DUF1990 domain-containing protein [Saccharopolyspora sp. 6V]MCA1227962.1 DUF1990 domain-containing protein [Saccharopolyspora sp. 6M]MCA1282525.1 DUF1990 domain-containing protein [Saccharopolyspora sp. 7B]